MENQDIQKKIHFFQEQCRRNHLKVTPQRVAVYMALIESHEHPSAETVCREVRKIFPSISLDTVNRTLNTIQSLGLSFPVEGSGEAKRYDGNLDDHQHFRCLSCNKIIDIFDHDFGQIEVPEVLKGEKILRKTVYFEGICKDCQKN